MEVVNDPCDFCPAHMSPLELSVLDQLSDGEIVYPASMIAADIGAPLAAVRAAIKRLRALRLATCGYLVNEEGFLAGRGSWLTWGGDRLQTLAREAAASGPGEDDLAKAWILDLYERDPDSPRVRSWTWTYAFRGWR